MKNAFLFKKVLPYILISLLFFGYIFFKHQDIFKYKFNLSLVSEYLRSQDIEDKDNVIKNRVFLSDSDLYIASGYLYAKGASPTEYDFQVPPLIKYFFGFSILMFGNPFYVQIIFGLILLWLTYFLGMKLFKNPVISMVGTLLLLIDPVFNGMMNGALLDLGQTVFALSYTILMLLYPEKYVLQGITLGLFAVSKFWSPAFIFVMLILGYKIVLARQKLNYKKLLFSLLIAFVVFCLIYIVAFVKSNGLFNIFAFEGRVLKFMLSHNSAGIIGGPIVLFISGFFVPWWQNGILRAGDWSFIWPIALFVSIFLGIKIKLGDPKFFFYLLPLAYILLISTQVPFTRYFLIILPYAYLNLSSLLLNLLKRYNWKNLYDKSSN